MASGRTVLVILGCQQFRTTFRYSINISADRGGMYGQPNRTSPPTGTGKASPALYEDAGQR